VSLGWKWTHRRSEALTASAVASIKRETGYGQSVCTVREAGSLHLEAGQIDDKWHGFIHDSSSNTRIGSGTAPSLEKAKEQAEEVLCGKADWYFIAAEKKAPLQT
jgi:hypothetical protein